MDRHAAEAEAKVIRMEGVLDVPAARRLARELASAGDGEVHVDLSHVREFHDFGLALLVRELAGREGISIGGLGRHQERLLRYLGIGAGPEAHEDPLDLS